MKSEAERRADWQRIINDLSDACVITFCLQTWLFDLPLWCPALISLGIWALTLPFLRWAAGQADFALAAYRSIVRLTLSAYVNVLFLKLAGHWLAMVFRDFTTFVTKLWP